MEKIKLEFDRIHAEIGKFYDKKTWHFMTLNGVALDENTLEVQWLFAKYESGEIVALYTVVDYGQTLPDISDIIPSAVISQREMVDMFGINVQSSEKGLYLDGDSKDHPLRKERS